MPKIYKASIYPDLIFNILQQIVMDFTDNQNKACCPYNKSHVMDKEKLIFHLNRCKDKAKVKDKFRTCRFNRIHIVPQQDIEAHQLICPERQEILQITRRLRSTFEQAENQKRQRSREKCKKQERAQTYKQEIQRDKDEQEERNNSDAEEDRSEEMDQQFYYEDCPLCQNVVNRFQKMKSENISQSLRKKINLAEKLIKRYKYECRVSPK